MDIGTVAIYLSHGSPLVARCEDAPQGMRFIPATNAGQLADAAQQVLVAQGVDMHDDGLYLCPNELIETAQFPPLSLPADAVTFGTARSLLYPDVSPNTGWQRVRRDVDAGRLRVYRVGRGLNTTRYVSRAEVVQLAQHHTASSLASQS